MNDPIKAAAKKMERARLAYADAVLYYGAVCGGAGDRVGLIYAATLLRTINTQQDN